MEQPVEITQPGKVRTMLHHRHETTVICAACEIVTLREQVNLGMTSNGILLSLLPLWKRLDDLMQEMWGSGASGIDMGDLEEWLEEARLVRKQAYDPEVHKDVINAEELEPGDPVYIYTDLALKLRAMAMSPPKEPF